MTQANTSSSGSKSSSSKEILDAVGLNRPTPENGQLKVIDDPFGEFIRNNWRSFLTTIAVGAAIFYAVSVYRSTQLSAQQASGDSFIGLQRTFEELQQLSAAAKDSDPSVAEKQVTAKEEAQKRFDSQVKSLSFAKAPYPYLASFYQTLSQISDPQNGGALRAQIIEQSEFSKIENSGLERLVAELKYLAAARGEIDGNLNLARKSLEALATSGTYAAAAAVRTLSRIADSAETIASAKALTETLLTRQPELSSELSDGQ